MLDSLAVFGYRPSHGARLTGGRRSKEGEAGESPALSRNCEPTPEDGDRASQITFLAAEYSTRNTSRKVG